MGKFNVNFSDSVYKLVGETARDHDTTMSDVIRDAVSLLASIDDELRAGHKILVDIGNGNIKEIMFPWARTLKSKRPELPAPEPIEVPVSRALVSQPAPAVAGTSSLR